MVKTYGNTFVQKLEDLPQAVGPRFYSSIALNPYTPPRTEFWVTDDCSAPGVALGGPRIELQRKKMDLPSVLAALPKTGTKTLQFSGKWEKSPTNGLWILRYICFDPDWDPERLYYLHCHDILGLGVYRVCEQRERAPNEQNVLQGHSALLILKGDIDFERRMRQGVGDLDKLSDVQTYTAQVARDLGRTALPTLYVSILSPVPYSDMRLSQWLQATASAHP